MKTARAFNLTIPIVPVLSCRIKQIKLRGYKSQALVVYLIAVNFLVDSYREFFYKM